MSYESGDRHFNVSLSDGVTAKPLLLEVVLEVRSPPTVGASQGCALGYTSAPWWPLMLLVLVVVLVRRLARGHEAVVAGR